MLKRNAVIAISLTGILLLEACKGSELGYKKRGEKTAIGVCVRHRPPVINADTLNLQTAYALNTSRGSILPGPSTAIDLAATGIKELITKEKAKYSANYNFMLSSDNGRRLTSDSTYFYSGISHSGPFDVRNMQFDGFTVARLYDDRDEPEKVAMAASFALDTTNLYEIAYDGVFRLRLKDIRFNFAKAKVPRGKKKIDVSISVVILASYITKEGRLNRDDTIGRFTTLLHGIDLGKPDDCQRFANTPMFGWSFVVPRSYCRDMEGNDIWNKGNYKILVSVNETSKPGRINGWVLKNGSNLVQDQKTTVDVKGLLENYFSTNASKKK